MRLLQAWSESLTLLKPQNLKLFLLVTLKSIIDTYKILLTKFWPIMLAPFIIMGLSELMGDIGFALGALGLCAAIWFMLILLCARPSVGIKNWNYALSYWRHGIYFCLFVPIFIFFIVKLLNVLSLYVHFAHYHLLFYSFSLPLVYVVLCMAFLLDSAARLRDVGFSLYRGGKMILYNLPFILISALSIVCLSKVFFYIITFSDATGYLYIFLLPIPVCFYMNFYIKKLHEQFNLYFEAKG